MVELAKSTYEKLRQIFLAFMHIPLGLVGVVVVFLSRGRHLRQLEKAIEKAIVPASIHLGTADLMLFQLQRLVSQLRRAQTPPELRALRPEVEETVRQAALSNKLWELTPEKARFGNNVSGNLRAIAREPDALIHGYYVEGYCKAFEQLKPIVEQIKLLRAMGAHRVVSYRRIGNTNHAVRLRDAREESAEGKVVLQTALVDFSGNILFQFGGEARVEGGNAPSSTNVRFGEQVVSVVQEDDGWVSVMLPDQRVFRLNKRGKRKETTLTLIKAKVVLGIAIVSALLLVVVLVERFYDFITFAVNRQETVEIVSAFLKERVVETTSFKYIATFPMWIVVVVVMFLLVAWWLALLIKRKRKEHILYLLRRTIREGNPNKIKRLLEWLRKKRFNLNARDKPGKTVLDNVIYSAMNPYIRSSKETLDLFLGYGADVNVPSLTKWGTMTPMEAVLMMGCHVHNSSEFGQWSPRAMELLKLFLTHGGKVNTALTDKDVSPTGYAFVSEVLNELSASK